jgi:hypothetical protein
MEAWVSTYAERMKRKDARLERGTRNREEWAGKAEHRSNQACEKSIKIVGRMEIGRPGLIGHHSEKRHRSDIRKLEREGRTDSRSYTEAQEKLAYWQARRDEVCSDFESQVADATAKRIADISASKWVFSYIYGWTELVKVNRATVEVKSNFPSQPNFKYPIKFVDHWQSKTKSSNHD